MSIVQILRAVSDSLLGSKSNFLSKMAFAPPASLIALLATMATANSQGPPGSGMYGIQSGSYRQDGGFVGSIDYPLPNAEQAFVSLVTDPRSGLAELSFLDQHRKAVFLRLTNGILSGNSIRFQYLTTHPYGADLPPAWVDYTVTNQAGSLAISGSMTSPPVCCDIPYLFAHSDVRTSLVPILSLRVVSGVELCWNSASNQNYQVQYHSNLLGSFWVDLGPPVRGDGALTCVTDAAVPEQPRRFYRLVTWP